VTDQFTQEIDPAKHIELLQNLDLAFFARLLGKVTGGEQPLAILDGGYQPIVVSDAPLGERLAEGLASLPPSSSPPPDFLPLSGLGTLVLTPLPAIGNGGGNGLLATLAPEGCEEQQRERLREALRDIAEAISQFCQKDYELNDMAEEVSARYEELNIVYDFGAIIKQHLRGESLYKTLLQLCIDRLEVDLAVFIHPDDQTTTYLLHDSKQFVELDLLLTRFRGEVYRFVESGQEPVVLNHSDDPRRLYLWMGMPYKFLAAPIIFKKRMKAMVVILRDENAPDFSNSDRKLMGVICEQVGTLLHNEEMYAALFIFTEQMASALIEAVDAKDPYTRGHSDRVNHYAMHLGRAIKLSEAELKKRSHRQGARRVAVTIRRDQSLERPPFPHFTNYRIRRLYGANRN